MEKESKKTVAKTTKKKIKEPSKSLAEAVTKTKKSSRDIIHVNYVYEGPEGGEPAYAHDGDIGMDVVATAVEYNHNYDSYIYHTGIYAESLEKGTGAFAMLRSSNYKTDAMIWNGVGLVDSFLYRGEICFMFKNRTPFTQRVADSLMYLYLSLPWYKKLFMPFNKYSDKHREKVTMAYLSRVSSLIDAPYKVGDKMGQLVWMKFPEVILKKLESREMLSATERGEGGFGSTGK